MTTVEVKKDVNPHGVAVGQYWTSCDRRDHGKRRVEVVKLDGAYAVVCAPGATRTTRVRLDRFRSGSTGWQRS